MNATDFKEFLQQAKKVVPRKASLPEIENILFDGGWLNVTDLQTTLRKKIEGLPEEKFMINFLEFEKLIAKLKTGELSISLSEGKVKIETEKGTFYFAEAEKLENFPNAPKLSPDNLEFGELTEEDIVKIKKAVNYSVNDKLRPVMESVLINKEHIVATDTHVLCFYSRETESDLITLMPKETVPVLGEKECKVETDGKSSKLTYENGTEIFFRNVEGSFPGYEAVIPKEFNGSIVMDVKELMECVDIALLSANESLKLVIFTVSGKELKISSQDIDSNKSYCHTLEAKSATVDSIQIGLNGKRLLNTLKIEKYKEVSIRYVSPDKCVIINEEVLLMPIMIKA